MAEMRPAAEMKNSGIEWIGDIPVEWDIAVLGRYVKQVKNKNTDLLETNLLSLRYGKVKRKDISANDGLLPASFDGYNIIEEGDIVLRLTDLQNDHTSLRVGRATERGIITSAYVTIRPEHYISSEYLYYVLHSFDIVKGFYGMGAGIRQGLTYDGVQSLKIPSPAMPEQQAIADYLDDRCSKIDEIIAEATASIEEYKELKQAVIFEAVTKGLDKNVPMKDSGVEWIGSIPKHWQRVQLRYLLDKSEYGIKVGPFGSSFTNKTVGDGDYLIYGQANVISRDFSKTKNSVTEDVYKSLSRYDVVSGDICLSVIGNGTIGWCCTVPENIKPGIMDSHLMKIRLSNQMTNEFFELYYSKHFAGVCHTQMQYQKTGIAMEGLNTRIVKGLWMVVPPLDEQKAIVKTMKPFVSNMDSIISEKQSLISDLQAYKKSLIYEVVTGKRRVV